MKVLFTIAVDGHTVYVMDDGSLVCASPDVLELFQ